MYCKVLLPIFSLCLLGLALGQADESCETNPAQTKCETYEIANSEAASDLNDICQAGIGWPTGCAMWEECVRHGEDTDGQCTPLSLILTVCAEDGTLAGCEKYDTICGEGSLVPGCNDGIDGIPTSQTIYDATVAMCTEMPDMVGCETCTSGNEVALSCPNPLKSISVVCLGMWMKGCEVWVDFCEATQSEPSIYSWLCTGEEPEALSMGADTVPSNDGCITDPTQEECKTFVMSDTEANKDLDQLCYSMPNMVGCSLRTACVNGTANGQWCTPFTLLGTICEEMSTMKGCANYNSLCFTPGSVVEQCAAEGPIPNAPSTEEARRQVMEMCADHGMVGCETCTSMQKCPHPLDSLSTVCIGMPGMAGCKQFFDMCGATGESFSELCGDDAYQGLPPMRMWMHVGITDIVLLKEWIPRNGAEYFGTLVACFFAALFVQWLKAFRIQQELEWASQRPLLPCRNVACGGRVEDSKSDDDRALSEGLVHQEPSGDSWRVRTSSGIKSVFESAFGWCRFTKSQFNRNIIRSLFSGVVIFLDYMLMLIVMTFNLGIILATVFGYMIGALLLGHIGEKAGGASTAPQSDTEVDVRFMEPPSCCGSTRIL